MTSHENYQELAALAALDALTGDDLDQWQDHVRGCEECRRMEEDLRESSSMLALGIDPVSPPDGVRDRVMRHVESASTQGRADARKTGRWIAVAAALFLLLFWRWTDLRLDQQRTAIADLAEEREKLTEENRRLEATNQKLASQIESLAGAEEKFVLSGLEAAPSASARVFLDQPNRRAFVFFRNLPENPGDKSYQLWIIRADREAPESAGVFDAGADGSAKIVVENLPVGVEIEALAVTLEPKGGVPAPTGEMLLTGGKI